MSCTNCKKIEAQAPDIPGLEYSLLDSSPIQGRDGRLYKISSCLIPIPYTPAGGWSVVFNIHGQRITVTGSSSREIFVNTKKIFELNNLTVFDKDIWFNLNIQWTKKTILKRVNVSLIDLLSRAEINADEDQSSHEVPRWNAVEWSPRVWGMPEAYLAQTEYNYSKFLILVESVCDLFDKNLNPLIGNTRCYVEARKQFSQLLSFPIYTQEQAREFLWSFKKSINSILEIDTLDFIQTSQENHWT